MLPGRDLAALTGLARTVGLGQFNDDELIGFVCAARRNASWQQALELEAVAELAQPRPGTLAWTLPSGRTYTTEPDPYPV
jgi:hypothetical protein